MKNIEIALHEIGSIFVRLGNIVQMHDTLI